VASKLEQMGHILGPRGWLEVQFPGPVGDAIFENRDLFPMSTTGDPRPAPPPEALHDFICFSLMPAVAMPHYRAMDITFHRKTLSTDVLTACMTYYTGTKYGKYKFMELRLGSRRYLVMLWPDSVATAPLGHMAHRLYILCRQPQCDLSPLFALADPLHFPQHAAAVARTYYMLLSPHPRPTSRWLPACDYVECGKTVFAQPDYDTSLARSALDILSDPEKLNTLTKLVYSQTRDLRALGFKHGLWTLDPAAEPGDLWRQVEDAVKRRDLWQAMVLLHYAARQPDAAVPHGQFTVAASAALSYYAHMLPFKVLLAKDLLRLSIQ